MKDHEYLYAFTHQAPDWSTAKKGYGVDFETIASLWLLDGGRKVLEAPKGSRLHVRNSKGVVKQFEIVMGEAVERRTREHD